MRNYEEIEDEKNILLRSNLIKINNVKIFLRKIIQKEKFFVSSSRIKRVAGKITEIYRKKVCVF